MRRFGAGAPTSGEDEAARTAVPAPRGPRTMQMDSAQPAVERVVRKPVGAPGDDVAPERRERERPRSRGALVRVERDERVRAPAQLAKPRRELEVAHAVGTDRLAGSHCGEEPRSEE